MSLSGKLFDCSCRNIADCELFIVQGEATAQVAGKARNRQYQAILPILGTFINVVKAPLDEVLQNEEVRTIITAVGTGIGIGEGPGAFNMERLRYQRIILLTTPNPVGLELRAQLLTFFLQQMPELIRGRYIYLPQSPFPLILDPLKRRISPVHISEATAALSARDSKNWITEIRH